VVNCSSLLLFYRLFNLEYLMQWTLQLCTTFLLRLGILDCYGLSRNTGA
jgi:hypothetical protein